MGFQNAGFNIAAAFDNWKPAIDVYRQNFQHPIYEADLGADEIKEEISALEPQLLIGGPPCQDFSSAGPNNFTKARASLVGSFVDLVQECLPRYFVMENVPRIRHAAIYLESVERLRKLGYGISQSILDASYCGVPQSRKRLFLVGQLGAKDHFLDEPLAASLSLKPMTMREYFGDSLGIDHYFRIPTTYQRKAVFSVDEPSVTIRGVDRPIPKTYKRHRDDLADVRDGVRGLTIEERSYVQTFPRTFEFSGTKTNLNQMIGNAVPVKLAEYVARTIMQLEESSQLIEPEAVSA
mgnify:CR=1 FL=1